MFGEILNRQGERLDYTLHPGQDDDKLVILGHGVTGNKDRPFVVALAEGLCAAGMGGAVGVLRSSSDGRIRLLVSLAGMVHTEAFAQREFGEETPNAGLMWEDEECPLSHSYMDDMAQIGSVVGLADRIKVPWLFVHGTEDDVVPPQDTLDIMAVAPGEVQLLELPGADHVFRDNATAPMVGGVVAWLSKQLHGE